MTKQSQILLLDKNCNIESIKDSLFKNLVICFDYETHIELEKNNVDHDFSDNYLTDKDLDEIHLKCFSLCKWFNEKEVSNQMLYDEVNLGELFYMEIYYTLNHFLKIFLEVYHIFQENKSAEFFCSEYVFQILKHFSSSIKKIDKKNSDFMDDFIYIQLPIFNKKWQIHLSKSNFRKIQKLLEKFVKKNNIKQTDQKLFLLSNFTTLKSKDLLLATKNTSLTFLKYDLHVPPFWNFETFNLIKQSQCIVETKNSLINNSIKKFSYSEIVDEKINFLNNNDLFFSDFFSIKGISFWDGFKPIFMNMCKTNFYEGILNIHLTKKLFSKYTFSGIVLLDESRSYEQIIIHFAKKLSIPIFLLPHGLPTTSPKIFKFNQLVRTIPIHSDKFLVWGDHQKQYHLKQGLSNSKIESVGSFLFDKFSKNVSTIENSKKNNVLLATDFLALHHPQNFCLQYHINCEKILKQIYKIVTDHDHDLILKPHPGNNVIEKQLSKNWSRAIFETSDIVPLIRDSSLVIVTDLTTVILEAFSLDKPVISLRLRTEYDDSDIFLSNACLRINMSDLDTVVNKILNDSNFREELLYKQQKFLQKYISNYGDGANNIIKNLLKFSK